MMQFKIRHLWILSWSNVTCCFIAASQLASYVLIGMNGLPQKQMHILIIHCSKIVVYIYMLIHREYMQLSSTYVANGKKFCCLLTVKMLLFNNGKKCCCLIGQYNVEITYTATCPGFEKEQNAMLLSSNIHISTCKSHSSSSYI